MDGLGVAILAGEDRGRRDALVQLLRAEVAVRHGGSEAHERAAVPTRGGQEGRLRRSLNVSIEGERGGERRGGGEKGLFHQFIL